MFNTIYIGGGKKQLKLLKQILAEVKTLKQDLVDNEVIKKQAELLDKSTNELKEAVKKNTPK